MYFPVLLCYDKLTEHIRNQVRALAFMSRISFLAPFAVLRKENRLMRSSRFEIGFKLWKTWLAMMVDINRVWENIKVSLDALSLQILGYYEVEYHKPWFEEACLKLFD
jgi:hypothetical protein